MVIVVKKIKYFRTSRGLSQKKNALKVGIDQAQYSRIESCKVESTLSSLNKIAESLDIKISDLFNNAKAIDINFYDKNVVNKIRLIDELEDIEKKSIFTILDIATSRKRVNDNLQKMIIQ